MNEVLESIRKRKSIRAYEEREIEEPVKEEILKATLRAPTAGNMMLYSIIEVKDGKVKETLVKTCDNQPFIARAPLVLLFLADYQRWYDFYIASDVPRLCEEKGLPMKKPTEADLFLACCDAVIAAQTAVIAAESLGVGSCYIGDIMENYETHRELFNLPPYVFPIALVCFGYPTPQQKERALTERFDRKYIVFEEKYRRLDARDFEAMFETRQRQAFGKREEIDGAHNIGQLSYLLKFDSAFAREMTRSVRVMLESWRGMEETVS